MLGLHAAGQTFSGGSRRSRHPRTEAHSSTCSSSLVLQRPRGPLRECSRTPPSFHTVPKGLRGPESEMESLPRYPRLPRHQNTPAKDPWDLEPDTGASTDHVRGRGEPQDPHACRLFDLTSRPVPQIRGTSRPVVSVSLLGGRGVQSGASVPRHTPVVSRRGSDVSGRRGFVL